MAGSLPGGCPPGSPLPDVPRGARADTADCLALLAGAPYGSGRGGRPAVGRQACCSPISVAIAVAIATFGVTSGLALSGVVGLLIEVPVLVALVYVSLAWRRRFTTTASA